MRPYASFNHALINGKEMRYNICDETRNDPYYLEKEQEGLLKYLGKGTISRIGNKKQPFEDKLHFWRWTALKYARDRKKIIPRK